MINKLKKQTFFSLFFLSIVLVIYFIPNILDRDYYRKILGLITIYVFYPFLFLSVFFSIKNLILINSNKKKISKRKWIIVNSLSIIFILFFIVKIIWVMLGVV